MPVQASCRFHCDASVTGFCNRLGGRGENSIHTKANMGEEVASGVGVEQVEACTAAPLSISNALKSIPV